MDDGTARLRGAGACIPPALGQADAVIDALIGWIARLSASEVTLSQPGRPTTIEIRRLDESWVGEGRLAPVAWERLHGWAIHRCIRASGGRCLFERTGHHGMDHSVGLEICCEPGMRALFDAVVRGFVRTVSGEPPIAVLASAVTQPKTFPVVLEYALSVPVVSGPPNEIWKRRGERAGAAWNLGPDWFEQRSYEE